MIHAKTLGAVSPGKSEGEDVDGESGGENGKADTGVLDRSIAILSIIESDRVVQPVQHVPVTLCYWKYL